MTTLLPVQFADGHTRLVKLAREIAINHFDTETILSRYQISAEEWRKLQTNPEFIRVLTSEIEAWASAANTHDRTKLKAAALIEEWLPEANRILHDHSTNISGRAEVAKLVAKIAEMGLTNAAVGGGSGERFNITINLGADSQLKFEKQVTPRVIEGEAVSDA